MAEEKKSSQTQHSQEAEQRETSWWNQLSTLWQANPKLFSGILIGIVVLIGGLIWFYQSYLPEQEKEAQEQMIWAIRFFEKDSLDLALNGTSQYPGFLQLEKEYALTKSGELCKYYIGIIYLQKGQLDLAIDYLEDFDKGENFISASAYAALGAAYVEKGEYIKGAKNYLKAAEIRPNTYTSPIFLLDAAYAYELANMPVRALEIYQKIKKQYPNSEEGKQVDKYIARLKIVTENQ